MKRRLEFVSCFFGIIWFIALSVARAEDPKIPTDSAQALAELRQSVGADAGYTLGDSKAFQLVTDAQIAYLNSLTKNKPLTLSAQSSKVAFDVVVRSIAGTEIPANFLELEAARVKRAPKLNLGAGPNPSASSFDWRRQKKVTPIRDQGGCGSCWCFAAVATYESSRWINFQGQPSDLDASEQEILNCGHTGGCAGDWYYTAWAYMQSSGTATEAAVPYHGGVGSCDDTVAKPYIVDTYGLVSANQRIPAKEEIKKALCQYGPLAVAVDATQRFVAYADGVFKDYPSNGGHINHAVTLIGWDDNKGAWLIKNSWGPDWGSTCGFGSEKGYMWIGYDNNNIGYAAAWVVAQQ